MTDAIIASFEPHLLAENKSPKTIRTYCDAARKLTVPAVLRPREALVTGKGGRQRGVTFGAQAAVAVDRYLRVAFATPAAVGITGALHLQRHCGD